MYFKPIKLTVNNGNSDRFAIVCEQNPRFGWSAFHEKNGQRQTEYNIEVTSDGKALWRSGWVKSSECEAVYRGESISDNSRVEWRLTLKDSDSNISSSEKATFFFATNKFHDALWIKSACHEKGRSECFVKQFETEKQIKSAVLYVCGIGYQYVTINGKKADDAYIQPLISTYSKKCYCTPLDITELLCEGKNSVCVEVGYGWRNTLPHFADVKPDRDFFRGEMQMMCKAFIKYTDGSEQTVVSDDSWKNLKGAVTDNNLFDGETYDARLEISGKDTADFDISSYPNAVLSDLTPPVEVRNIEPVTEARRITPVSRIMISQGKYVFDLGVNIAGIVEITLPENMPEGHTIHISHAENLEDDGTLSPITLRNVKACDTYIASGNDNKTWYPKFIYHGFRYICVEGWYGIPEEKDITAISFYTAIDNKSRFDCGSALIRRIHDNIVQTERNNLHGIATDCPQRNERMGWMNDATVRFEETSYNFNISRLFPKIIDDIVTEQGEDGAITCTAPYVFGHKPADPVSSSFIIAAILLYYHCGNTDVIKKYYNNFKMWNECLRNNSTDGIVDITFYGDWASPSDNCIAPERPQSAITPGILMSTGYHYYNYTLLSKMAEILGNAEEKALNDAHAERVKKAFLDKWLDYETGTVASGSQGCQAFSLWLGILPEEIRTKSALRMHEAVMAADYKFTTGNLTTKYLIEMLADYGYIEDAWKLMMREEYPSFGFEIQNGATTIWERFELKRTTNMNSHDHPMYGSVGSWLYSRLCGVRPTDKGWREFEIKPILPEKLTFAEAQVDTVRGSVYVKWMKHFGKTVFNITVPFSSRARFIYKNEVKILESGFYSFEYSDQI